MRLSMIAIAFWMLAPSGEAIEAVGIIRGVGEDPVARRELGVRKPLLEEVRAAGEGLESDLAVLAAAVLEQEVRPPGGLLEVAVDQEDGKRPVQRALAVDAQLLADAHLLVGFVDQDDPLFHGIILY